MRRSRNRIQGVAHASAHCIGLDAIAVAADNRDRAAVDKEAGKAVIHCDAGRGAAGDGHSAVVDDRAGEGAVARYANAEAVGAACERRVVVTIAVGIAGAAAFGVGDRTRIGDLAGKPSAGCCCWPLWFGSGRRVAAIRATGQAEKGAALARASRAGRAPPRGPAAAMKRSVHPCVGILRAHPQCNSQL